MIQVDESDPIDDVTPEPTLPQRDVTIKRGIDANDYYELIEEIGRGKFGTVYNCREKSTGLKLAAKNIPIPKRDDRRNVEREVEIMNSLQHPKIIQLYDAYEYCKNMWVILELIEGGELFERVIDDNYLLTEKACIVIIRQVCEAMEFVHRNSILHLDLKPENILCTTRDGNRIKIIDFGLARKYDPDKKLQVLFGTPEFVAPEVVNFDTISFGTDMWSVGVICYVLLSGLSPFMGENDIETMTNVTVSKYDFDDEAFNDISPEAINFITKLLIKDINERMTAAECLDHKWLKRRPCLRPQLAPKPIILPPPKFKPIITDSLPIITSPTILTASLTSPPIQKLIECPTTPIISLPIPMEIELNLENGILDKTKENLKEFVQRWGEHPNSPYIFDRENNYITPPIQLELKANSNLSSRGCSPSPCESITSTNGLDIENNEENNNQNTNNDNNNSINSDNDVLNNVNGSNDNDNSNKNTDSNIVINNNSENENNNSIQSDNQTDDDYLKSIERRRSDSNCILTKDKSNYDQINLADEIKKLSDRLFMLSQMNIDIGITASDNNINNNTPVIYSNGIDKSNNENIENNTVCNNNDSNDSKKEEIIQEPREILIKPELMKKPEVYKSKLNEAYNHKVQIPNAALKQSIFRSMRSNSSSFDKVEENYLSDLSDRSETLRFNGRSYNTTNSSSAATNENYTQFNRRSFTTQSSRDSIFSQMNGNDLSTNTTSPVWASSLSTTPSTRRTKFRINHASRDVPLAATTHHHHHILNNHHQHKTILIEDSAKTTKDCLLRLLDKYDRNGSTNGNSYSSSSNSNFMKSSKLSSSSSSSSTASLNCNTIGRHQSISVDWGISDNLENHTMNSINAFFHRYGNRNNGCVKKIQTQIESRK